MLFRAPCLGERKLHILENHAPSCRVRHPKADLPDRENHAATSCRDQLRLKAIATTGKQHRYRAIFCLGRLEGAVCPFPYQYRHTILYRVVPIMKAQTRLGVVECPQCGSSLEVFPRSIAWSSRDIEERRCTEQGLLNNCRHTRSEVANLRELASANAGLSSIPASRRHLG